MKEIPVLPLEPAEPLPLDHPLAGHEDSIDALRECGRLFHARGWSVGTSSNYSTVLSHNPVRLIVTASGMDKGRLARNDFVHVGPDGLPVETGQPKSSAETMLHVVLAERAGAGAVLHTHSIWGTLLSDRFFDAGGFEIEGYEMLKGLEGNRTHEMKEWIPIFDNTQDIPSLAGDVGHYLETLPNGPVHGFLIRGHGLYTWGKDIFAARRHVEIYEFLFELVARQTRMDDREI